MQEEAREPRCRDDDENLHEKQGEGVEIGFLMPGPENAGGGDHVWRETCHGVILCSVYQRHNDGR